MKKLLLTTMITALLIAPLPGVALAEDQQATLPDTSVTLDEEFIPGQVPAQTDAAQAMTPAIHAMILSMFHYELTQYSFSDPSLGWETLYNMLSLYGQMDERSEYLDEQLLLPSETVLDFSSALFPEFGVLGALPTDLADRMTYDPEIDSYLVTCGNDSLAEIRLTGSQESASGILTLTGTLVYLVDGSDLAQFQATLQPQDNMFGYTITALSLLG